MNEATSSLSPRRLVVVSNRLPVVLTKNGNDWSATPGAGGLISALAPVLRNRGGLWIGWPGVAEETEPEIGRVLARTTRDSGYTLKPVMLTKAETEGFYLGFSNEIIWPLFHDLQSHCNFDPGYWEIYRRVNRKFASVIMRSTRKDDFIWVHDYHLMNVAKELRMRNRSTKLGFFLHIPFPPLDIFVKLPWRQQLLEALLEYDLIGFQTARDRRNFVQCIRALVPKTSTQGKGQVMSLHVGEREVRLGAFPIGIDFNDFARLANTEEVAELAAKLHADLPKRQVILGIDRLDYTKGIPNRFEAFRNLLTRYPELRRKVTLVQVVVPSRKTIPKYSALKRELDQLVGEINGQFTQSGWVPIHYIYRSLSREELLAYYRTCEIALITPLKDGMNLVAKEFCAANIEGRGVLILSEFAGAAAQLQRAALLVNPYSIEGVADAMYHAFTMPAEERGTRMKKLRRNAREYDIFWWVDAFLRAAIAKDLSDFPVPDEYGLASEAALGEAEA